MPLYAQSGETAAEAAQISDQVNQPSQGPLSDPGAPPPDIIVAPGNDLPLRAPGDDQREDLNSTAVRIGSVLIEGGEGIDNALFAGVIEQFIGSQAAPDTLANLTRQIAAIARNEGHIFASARVPEQSVALGLVRVQLDMGRIDAVRLVGSDNRAVLRTLQALVGTSPTQSEVEHRLLVAGDIPAVRLHRITYARENGERVLIVEVREQDNNNRAQIDNYGTSAFGPVRAFIGVEFRGLLDDADLARVSVRGTPAEPGELLAASIDYSTAINSSGTRLGVTASISENEPGGLREGLDITGDSQFVSLYARHPLIRSRQASLWATARLSYLSIEQSNLNALILSDSTTTLSLSLVARMRAGGGGLTLGTEFVRGLEMFGATRRDDPFRSRFEGDGVFSRGRVYADWTAPLGGDFSVRMAMDAQLASRPLLASQQFALGGANWLRGYDIAERLGDNGVAGLIEVRHDFNQPTSWLDRAQIYGFVDAGYVDNAFDRPGSSTLVSAGGGLRADIGPVDLAAEAALPVNADRRESNDRSPHINLMLGVDF